MSGSTGSAIAVVESQASCSELSCTNDGTRVGGDDPSGRRASSNEALRPAGPRPLVECVYIAVICVPCECVRIALAAEPRRKMIECPACGRLSFWKVLGRGATVRPLPFYQRLRLGQDRHRKNRVPWTEYDTYESEQKDRDGRERQEEEIDEEI